MDLFCDGGPALSPIPPCYLDPNRPGHYMKPPAALSRFAADKFGALRGDCLYPSQIALGLFKRAINCGNRSSIASTI